MEEIVTSDPVPTTDFETWGQVLIRIKHGTGSIKIYPGGIILIFAISDADRQWLGWYIYADSKVIYTISAATTREAPEREAPHHVYGKYCDHPQPFSTPKPITVEEFAGPLLYARGGRRGKRLLREAKLFVGHRNLPDTSDIVVKIEHEIGPLRFHVSVNPTHGSPFGPGKWRKDEWRYGFDEEDIGIGFVRYLMSEPFDYPVPHLNVRKRLKYFEHVVTS